MQYLIYFLLALNTHISDGVPQQPEQATEGPGSSVYLHDSVRMSDFGEDPDGFYLFEPAAPVPDSAPVVVFNHGYGALNPMVYGGWIRHLVRKGNIVIYPRYQENMLQPLPKHFAENIATGIRDALTELEMPGRVRPLSDQLAMVGHSYGGAMTAYFAAKFADHNLPQPKAVMLCSPGTGPFEGGRLDSYADIPADTRMLILINDGDHVVGTRFQYEIFETAVNTPHRNFLIQRKDEHGGPALGDGHNECYSLDEGFDTGLRNPTVLRSFRIATTDAVDYHAYWKLFDALLDCQRSGTHCAIAFGNTAAQRSLGCWSDGRPLKELEVKLP